MENRADRKAQSSGLGRHAFALAAWAIRRPRLALLVSFFPVLLALPGLARLEIRTDGHALVPADEPVVAVDAEIRRHFGLHDPIVVLIETSHPDGVFNHGTLAKVEAISKAVLGFEGIEPGGVTSLATEKRDRVYVGTLNFRPFLDPVPSTDEEMALLRSDVAAAGILEGTLLSTDHRAATVLVAAPPGGDGVSRARLYERLVELIEPYQGGGDTLSVVGAPVAEALLGQHILEDLAVLLPLALLVLSAVIWLGCRRLWGVVLAMVEVGACLAFTFGSMGWLGAPVYLTTAVLPVILTTLGLADEIHVFWCYQRLLAAPGGDDRLAALRRTMAEMARPVVLTSLTTGLALLSFAVSPIAPVSTFGVFAAVGTFFCMLWSLIAIPASLALLPRAAMARPAASRTEEPGQVEMQRGERLARWVDGLARRRGGVLAALALLTVGLGWGVARLEVQDSWVDGFAPDSAFFRATQRANQLLYGTHTLLLHLRFDPPADQVPKGWSAEGPLLSRPLLEKLGELERFARARPEVGGALGTYSHLTTVAYLWLGRREGTRAIPDELYKIERALDRFDVARGEQRRREVIDDDLRRTVISLYLKDANYRDTARLMTALRGWVEQNLAPWGARLDFAGDVAVSQAMIPAIVRTQISSLALALVAALLILALVDHPRRAVVTLLPTLCAALWVLGAMGWAGIPLGVATSMFCAITLGIGVDYGIHFMERRELVGVHAAVAETGPAIVADTLAIGLGFGILAFSQVPANARLGLLVATALVAAAFLTLAGLPALLVRGRPRDQGGGLR